MNAFKNRTGFSLVELSIVLVILGLLVGGILAGQSLIRAAELRATITQTGQYRIATFAFRDKYFALPGDIDNASSFWGPYTTSGTAASVTGASNGDRSGYISSTEERLAYFRHLALAGLIEGSYAGLYTGTSYLSEGGVTVPFSKSASKNLMSINSNTSFSIYGMRNGTYLMHIAVTAPYNSLMPSELWQMDTKLDDGKASSGKVMPISQTTPLASRNCTTNDDWKNAAAGSADYKLDVTTIECAPLIFF